jgi:LPXTG-motif cell wall-anchored protein
VNYANGVRRNAGTHVNAGGRSPAAGNVGADSSRGVRAAGHRHDRGRNSQHETEGADSHERESGTDTCTSAVTRLKVNTHHNDNGEQHASGHLSVSPQFANMLRAEARAAAREEVQTRIGRGVGLQMRMQTPRPRRGEEQTFLQLIRNAWEQGGPARVAALLELSFGSPPAIVGQVAERGLSDTTSGMPAMTTGNSLSPTMPAGTPVTGPLPGDLAPGSTTPAGTPVAVAPDGTVPTSPTLGSPRRVSPAEGGSQAPENANGGGVLGTGGAAGPSALTPRSAAAATRSQLPYTGGDVPLMALLGGAALAAGALLRRRASH